MKTLINIIAKPVKWYLTASAESFEALYGEAIKNGYTGPFFM